MLGDRGWRVLTQLIFNKLDKISSIRNYLVTLNICDNCIGKSWQVISRNILGIQSSDPAFEITGQCLVPRVVLGDCISNRGILYGPVCKLSSHRVVIDVIDSKDSLDDFYENLPDAIIAPAEN